ncbi:protein D2-like [Bicyclus anynana]|uniref:Protein D2-like n=1 Tax=Bicyclus anynana TaxID=110368 RepID=A0ABM3LXU1_BICAN|nr:protein D2-like [Bicyclus anynana]
MLDVKNSIIPNNDYDSDNDAEIDNDTDNDNDVPDIDAPSRNSPVLRSYIIAIHVNIPHTSVMRGFSAAPYVPPTPEPGSGPHRYVLMVYEQCGEINNKDEELIRLEVDRQLFDVLEFIRQYNLELIAGTKINVEHPATC